MFGLSVLVSTVAFAHFAAGSYLAVARWAPEQCHGAPDGVRLHKLKRCIYEDGAYWKYHCAGTGSVPNTYGRAAAMYCGQDSSCYNCSPVNPPHLNQCLANPTLQMQSTLKSSELICADQPEHIGIPANWLKATGKVADGQTGAFFTVSDFKTNHNGVCATNDILDSDIKVHPTNAFLENPTGDPASAGKYFMYTCDSKSVTIHDCGTDSTCKTRTSVVKPLGCFTLGAGLSAYSREYACRVAMDSPWLVDQPDSTLPGNSTTPSTTSAYPDVSYTPTSTPNPQNNNYHYGEVVTHNGNVFTYVGGEGAYELRTMSQGEVSTFANGFVYTATTPPPKPTATSSSSTSAATTSASTATQSVTSQTQQPSQTGQPTQTPVPGSASTLTASSALIGVLVSALMF